MFPHCKAHYLLKMALQPSNHFWASRCVPDVNNITARGCFVLNLQKKILPPSLIAGALRLVVMLGSCFHRVCCAAFALSRQLSHLKPQYFSVLYQAFRKRERKKEAQGTNCEFVTFYRPTCPLDAPNPMTLILCCVENRASVMIAVHIDYKWHLHRIT